MGGAQSGGRCAVDDLAQVRELGIGQEDGVRLEILEHARLGLGSGDRDAARSASALTRSAHVVALVSDPRDRKLARRAAFAIGDLAELIDERHVLEHQHRICDAAQRTASKFSFAKRGCFSRPFSGPEVASSAALNAPESRPRPMGEYPNTGMPSSRAAARVPSRSIWLVSDARKLAVVRASPKPSTRPAVLRSWRSWPLCAACQRCTR